MGWLEGRKEDWQVVYFLVSVLCLMGAQATFKVDLAKFREAECVLCKFPLQSVAYP